tara:strand:- start:2544 stop:3659 length:1116 start_codon:yes stop_codon:yes gene_type:complete
MNPESLITPELNQKLESGALGKPVALEKITLELEAFFGDDEMMTRASLMNFAVFSESPECLIENHELIRDITRSHACRALLICVAPHETENRVRAWIEALCELNDRGGKMVCSEQVSFLLEGTSRDSLSSLVFSHLRSDLPLVAWWKGELSEYFQKGLYSRIDRLIVDSNRWTDPRKQFQILAEAHQAKGNQFDEAGKSQFLIHDLAYTRGHQHRRAIAHVFDDPRWLKELDSISEVEVNYANPHRTAALYWAAWLVAQLQASLVSKENDEFQYDSNGKALRLRLSETTDSESDRFFSSIRLVSAIGEILITPNEDPRFLSLVAKLGGSVTLDELFPATQGTDADLVSEILMRGGRNLLLRKVLPKLREML